MLDKIRIKVEKSLVRYAQNIDKLHPIAAISRVISRKIKDFILRPGKRIRPILFVTGYLGFTRRITPNLYTGAVSFELLHDFLLIHDDIIDKSDLRRGKPSMHSLFGSHLKKYKTPKFNGQDLAIVIGDIIYALAVEAFLCISEDAGRKEKALKKFIQSAIFTGGGEFIELLNSARNMEKISQEDIYKIYDYKTAFYTFASPLSIGATLAGAEPAQANLLFRYGALLGRAFQIQDDILGIYSGKKETGKSNLTDLQEAKKTILIWYAYHHSRRDDKLTIKRVLSKKEVGRAELLLMRSLLTRSGALDYAKERILQLQKKACTLIASSKIRTKYKDLLYDYSLDILNL